MNISWNRGEDPQSVARRFIEQNNLAASHLNDVVGFVMQAQQQAASGGGVGVAAGGGAGGQKDFNFPVQVGDGRSLVISWNRGEDPQTVAMNFAQQHGRIGADELPDIVNFIRQASGGPASPATMVAQQAPSVSPEQQQQAIMQVMEMGFDEQRARGALQASNWSVEGAISRLFG